MLEQRPKNLAQYQPGGVWDKKDDRDLLAFDVSLYGQGSLEAIRLDAAGLIQEKVSGEEEEGVDVFGKKDQIRLQMTPPKHPYIQKLHSKTGQNIMVTPEHLEDDKDILELMIDWRCDIAAMSQVREQFFASEVGDALFWYSGRAEEWESEKVREYNGKYAYLYFGKVIEEGGFRKLVTQDFKIDLNQEACDFFIKGVSTGLHCDLDSVYEEIPLYKGMTTVGRVEASQAENLNVETVWRGLSKAKESIQKDPTIFNLPVEVILALQDPGLQNELKENAATEIASWIDDQRSAGVSSFRIQQQVRRKFIDVTKKHLRIYDLKQDSEIDLTGGRVVKDDIQSYVSLYSGSNGDFCGTWGNETVSSGGDIGKSAVMIGGEYYVEIGLGEKKKAVKCVNPGCSKPYNICLPAQNCFNCHKPLPKKSNLSFSAN